VVGECGVVGFDVEFEFVEEAVFAQEVEAWSGIRVVLVGRGFVGLRLDSELSGEADFLLPSDRHVEEGGELVEFVLHVGVPERGVAFTTTPEDIAAAAEFLRDGDGFLNLGRRVGEDR
jgi:hypothetical protein